MGCPHWHGITAPGRAERVVAYRPIRRQRRRDMGFPEVHGVSAVGVARRVVVYGQFGGGVVVPWGFRCSMGVSAVLVSFAVESAEVERAARHGTEGEPLVGVACQPTGEVSAAGEADAPYPLLVGGLRHQAPVDQAADRAPGVGAVRADVALELGEGDAAGAAPSISRPSSARWRSARSSKRAARRRWYAAHCCRSSAAQRSARAFMPPPSSRRPRRLTLL